MAAATGGASAGRDAGEDDELEVEPQASPAAEAQQVLAEGANPAPVAAAAAGGAASAGAATGSRKAAIAAMIAKKREVLKQGVAEKQAFDVATTEKWSGLRITDRIVRQEKWDASMRGKDLVKFGRLAALTPTEKDRVVIGVLCAPVAGVKVHPTSGERSAELALCDLDKKNPQRTTLVLFGRALDHWGSPEGAGWAQCKVGSIFGVLNPGPAGKGIQVSFESQLLKLGTCPSLAFCDAKRQDGLPCKAPYNAESGAGFCPHHAALSHGERGRVAGHPRPVTSRPPARQALAPRLFEQQAVPRKRTIAESKGALQRLGRAEAEARELAAAVEQGGPARVAERLVKLEAMYVDAEMLTQTSLYEDVGKLVTRTDVVGATAKGLRRKWRDVLEQHRENAKAFAAAEKAAKPAGVRRGR